jgi:predicted phage tail protein
LAAGILARSISVNVDFNLMPIQFGAALGKLFGEHNRLLVTTLLKEAIFSLNYELRKRKHNLKRKWLL